MGKNEENLQDRIAFCNEKENRLKPVRLIIWEQICCQHTGKKSWKLLFLLCFFFFKELLSFNRKIFYSVNTKRHDLHAIFYSGTSPFDMTASVTSPSGITELCDVVSLDDCHYSIKFVPNEMGIHTVSVKHKDMHIPGREECGSFAIFKNKNIWSSKKKTW